MLLMLLWKVKRQGSDPADAPSWWATQLGVWKVKRQGSDAVDAPSWWATGCLEGETARL